MNPSPDCVSPLRDAGLDDMANWASQRPVHDGWKGWTFQELWDSSPQGDWLLYWAGSAGADRRDVVRAAAACVRPALRFVPEGEDRPRLAVEAAERWADRPTVANREKARRASRAAWAAAEAGAVAADAAGAVGYAACTLEHAAWAAWAAWAAKRAALVNSHMEGPESTASAHLVCAEDVRRLVPFPGPPGQDAHVAAVP